MFALPQPRAGRGHVDARLGLNAVVHEWRLLTELRHGRAARTEQNAGHRIDSIEASTNDASTYDASTAVRSSPFPSPSFPFSLRRNAT
jgi:hypothetical protein